jgi:hypothetical protein
MQSTSVGLFEQKEIAALSRPAIQGMDRPQLAGIIRAAGLPFLTASDLVRLPELGRKSLVKLGLMAREFCRSQGANSRWSALSE